MSGDLGKELLLLLLELLDLGFDPLAEITDPGIGRLVAVIVLGMILCCTELLGQLIHERLDLASQTEQTLAKKTGRVDLGLILLAETLKTLAHETSHVDSLAILKRLTAGRAQDRTRRRGEQMCFVEPGVIGSKVGRIGKRSVFVGRHRCGGQRRWSGRVEVALSALS